MITGILAVVGSILTIVIMFFSTKERKERKKADIYGQIKEQEYALGEALSKNDTMAITVISDKLDKLRKEYSFFNK